MYCFSHINGKLKTEEIETLLREKWILLIRYSFTKDENRLCKDILLYNRLVKSYEKSHYNGGYFSDIKLRKFERSITYGHYAFDIKAVNHHLTVYVKTPTVSPIKLLFAEYSKDNILLYDKVQVNSKYVEDNNNVKPAINDILKTYAQKRPANPYSVFYLDWDCNSKQITSRDSRNSNEMFEAFCNCYKSFDTDAFGYDLSKFLIKLRYNKKLYQESKVTTNYLSLLTGISYHTLANWGDELPMSGISFRNFVKVSDVLNGPTTFYDKFMDSKISTNYNKKYRNLSLKEIRTLANTSQAVFALILGVSRKHYLEIEKNPELLAERPVQFIYDLAFLCKCQVKQLFPEQLIERYQAEAQACASNYLRTNSVKKNSSVRKTIKTYIQQSN